MNEPKAIRLFTGTGSLAGGRRFVYCPVKISHEVFFQLPGIRQRVSPEHRKEGGGGGLFYYAHL
jgi:hypothetical protein